MNNTHNSLDDEGGQYEFVPELVSPVSDSPCNPDSIRMTNIEPGTVKTVWEPDPEDPNG